MTALATNVYNNALEAVAAATAKNISSFKGQWLVGTTYALGETVWNGNSFWISNIAGNVGNTPVVGANWSQVSSPRFGGASVTGSVTLLAGSAAVQKITTNAYGQFAKLPDATTMQLVSPAFTLQNVGQYDLKVIDSTGVIRGFVGPGENTVVGVADNSTAAGGWVLNDAKLLGVTAAYENATLSFGTGAGNFQTIPLDATRTAFLYGDTSCYVQVFDSTAGVGWGAPVLVRSGLGSGFFIGVLSATNQLLVASCDGTTAMQSVTVSIASVTPTVNSGTLVATTLGGNLAGFDQFLAIGSTFALAYRRATTTSAFRLFTVTGTTPTVGAETTTTTTAASCPIHLFNMSGNLLTMFQTSAANVTAKSWTFAGVVPTAGTTLTQTAAPDTVGLRTIQLGTRWVALSTNASTFSVAAMLISYTGTSVIAKTEVNGVLNMATLSASANPLTNVDAQVVNGKLLLCGIPTSTGTPFFNLLTDTAGTLSAGSQVIGLALGAAAFPAAVGGAVTGSVGRFIASPSNAGSARGYSVDCSGASPVVSTRHINGGGVLAKPAITNPVGCPRDPLTLNVSTMSTALPIPASGSVTGNRRDQAVAVGSNREFIYSQDLMAVNSAGAAGNTAQEAWLRADFGTGTFAANGSIFIQRIEAALP